MCENQFVLYLFILCQIFFEISKAWYLIRLTNLYKSVFLSSGVAELANVSVVHPRDPGSNLRTDRKYFLLT